LSLVMNIMIFLHVMLYTLLEINQSSGGMYCFKIVVLHSFRMLIRLYSVTFQKPTIITCTKMYSCCYRRMQTLFFILNTVSNPSNNAVLIVHSKKYLQYLGKNICQKLENSNICQ
jgi:hypothetical protein